MGSCHLYFSISLAFSNGSVLPIAVANTQIFARVAFYFSTHCSRYWLPSTSLYTLWSSWEFNLITASPWLFTSCLL